MVHESLGSTRYIRFTKSRIVFIVLAMYIAVFALAHQSTAQNIEIDYGFGEGSSRDIAVDERGNVYSAGWRNVEKYDAEGNLLWSREFAGRKDAIALDSEGNVYTTGIYDPGVGRTMDFDTGPLVYNIPDAGGTDVFISKLDSGGNFVWAKIMGGKHWEGAYDIAIDDDGNIFTTGYFGGTADFDPGPKKATLTARAHDDIFISKLDSDGNYLWANAMGGSGYAQGNAIDVDSAGNAYIIGQFEETVDFDPTDGAFSITSSGDNDLFIQKFDRDGGVVWIKSIHSFQNLHGNDIAVDHDGNLHITGSFRGGVDFDPGEEIASLSLEGSRYSDVFVLKLDSFGDYVWAKGIGGELSEWGAAISVDSLGNVYTAGSFYKIVDFDPDPDATFPIGNSRSYVGNFFVQKIDTNGSFIWVKEFGTNWRNIRDAPDYRVSGMALSNVGDIFVSGYFPIGNVVKFRPAPPYVHSIARQDNEVTNQSVVNYFVRFEVPIFGVDATDFILNTTDISDAFISEVSGSGHYYTVSVNTGTGDGTLSINW